MVGHNPFNPSARDRVFPATEERDIGVLVMFAVRKSLASADGVRRVVDGLVERGELDPAAVDADDPLGFLARRRRRGRPSPRRPTASPATSPAATWCSPAPAPSTTSTENVAAINGPPLPLEHQKRLQDLFGHIDCVTGD